MKNVLLMVLVVAISCNCFAANRTNYSDLIIKYSSMQNLDVNLVRSIIYNESEFNPNARSNKNAQGLMQVLPDTARFMGVNPSSLYDPEQNIIAGTRYLAFLKNRFNNDFIKIVAGYNAGHGAVEKFGGVPPYRETRNYVNLVTNRYNMLSSRNGNFAGVPQSNAVQTINQKPPEIFFISENPKHERRAKSSMIF